MGGGTQGLSNSALPATARLSTGSVAYAAYQLQRDLLAPFQVAADLTARMSREFFPTLADHQAGRFFLAANEMVARSHLTHVRPGFGIDSIEIEGVEVPVKEEAVLTTPFGTLVHFAKDHPDPKPTVLVVAALAGHFSTLLRSTVRALLPDHDVYITDWHNAREVPIAAGPFGFDDYVDLLMRFFVELGQRTHVVAVCQPCPATLAATAVMAESGDPATPRSLTLMAGPIDCRVSPTAVNELAVAQPLRWFEDNLITSVPWRFAGRGRLVYPGFLQVGAFMSMNVGRHVDQHLALFHELVAGDEERAETIKAFYDEYFAVLDLPAEFYLETVDRVFQRFLLPRGQLEHRGRRVDLSAITDTALFTVEGGLDDICGVGQTLAAQDLCPRIPDGKRGHHVQAGVGHYGVFSGSAWEGQISPMVRDFILTND